jgi:hypothetical protein
MHVWLGEGGGHGIGLSCGQCGHSVSMAHTTTSRNRGPETKADILYVTVGHILPGLGLSLLPDIGTPPGI